MPIPSHQGQADRKLEFTKCVWGVSSPLLANIVLDPLDKELESRGHKFARYADDFVVMVKSAKAAGG